MSYDLSIIVPVYNVEKYLNKCIQSILNQTFKNFELILINDGSTDDSGVICDYYSNIDNRIRVIHKQNGGLSSARNAGINIARGKFIAFVDSDDYVHEKMYEILLSNAIKNSSDLVICDLEFVYAHNVCDTSKNIINIEIETLTNIEALNELYSPRGVNFVIACNKIYRYELFKDIRYEEGRLHEDEFIIHKILYKTKKITYIPLKLYFYLQTENSITRSAFNIKKLDIVCAHKQRIEYFKNINQIDLQHKAENFYVQAFFSNYLKARLDKTNYKEINNLKKDFFMSFKTLLKNPFYNKKEKILWLLFILNPYIFEIYCKLKKSAYYDEGRYEKKSIILNR